ncbi:helix-turn-helix domain-containing protein [Cupriavidus sp. CV2]|uniref:helix-turn-helix domain-containing protein n=1 Tax=Cupriavidus ulmosensis TaxID=3065913 RepID=UPI00296AE250|nr:helix-turn-helix domain-containing protein [Cupriavidus sp. CV2]MDW3684891.1 helix-turn-helix domain-containing protein [Cupriavidus sp. CV2]
MGRKSKLTDAQWEAIGKRLLAGDAASALAREYGVSKTAISIRFSKRNETIKTVANQIVETERALSKLNVSEQMAARSLADSLKDISEHLAGAARFGAMTAHRLAGIAAQQVEKIDDVEPIEKSMKALIGVSTLTKLANGASEIGLNLLRANKEALEDASRGKAKAPTGLTHFYGESSNPAEPTDA